MPQLEQVIATITNEGEVSFEVKGVKGKGCLKATQEFEVAVGGGVIKRDPKPEMNMPPDIADRTTIGRG